MSNSIQVGQIYEDYEPLYDGLGKRRLRVEGVKPVTEKVWDWRNQRTVEVTRDFVTMTVISGADGKVPAKPRKVKIRADRIVPKRGGYVLVSEPPGAA